MWSTWLLLVGVVVVFPMAVVVALADCLRGFLG
jgi:hypothetical protein